ncbi:hypothetical protein [Halogranum amylolyticum]|uniref:hypothetical protein n=1 Tax=Halogranum amylolyticum TaxID=660520 RepID=UPI000A53FFF9|nr:hypothetical protein [Halogranum amylolyticum]
MDPWEVQIQQDDVELDGRQPRFDVGDAVAVVQRDTLVRRLGVVVRVVDDGDGVFRVPEVFLEQAGVSRVVLDEEEVMSSGIIGEWRQCCGADPKRLDSLDGLVELIGVGGPFDVSVRALVVRQFTGVRRVADGDDGESSQRFVGVHQLEQLHPVAVALELDEQQLRRWHLPVLQSIECGVGRGGDGEVEAVGAVERVRERSVAGRGEQQDVDFGVG